MWIIRWVIIALAVVVLAVLIGLNKDLETFPINYVFGEFSMSPLSLAFFSFVTGFLTWFIISLLHLFRTRNQLVEKERLILNLREELNAYRNESLNLTDDISKSPPSVQVSSAKAISEEEE